MRTIAMPFLLAALLTTAVGCGEETNASAASAGVNPSVPSTESVESAATHRTLSAALSEAKETGRNVLVLYSSEKCPFSRRMAAQTLADAEVKSSMDGFVVFRAEQGVNSDEFEKAWGKQPTPTVVTLDANGNPIGDMMNGVVQKSDFLAYAAWAKTGKGTQPAIQTGGG